MELRTDNIPDFWQHRWQTAQTGWDLRSASPPLLDFCLRHAPGFSARPLLIPGCGSGHEALALLENDFSDLTLLDIAPEALENLRDPLDARFPGWPQRLRLVCGDFFEHEGGYDLILEQTFFCALPPALRGGYAAKMWQLLNPGGWLAGVLFDREFPGGPPFGGSRAEYEAMFSPLFKVLKMETCRNSVAPRTGTEVFFWLEKQAASSKW